MRGKKKEQRTTWGIVNFPVRLRQRFLGVLKMEGKGITETMETLVEAELKKRGM